MKENNIYYYKTENGYFSSASKILGVEPAGHRLRLSAEARKILTDGNKRILNIEIAEEEKYLWSEVDMTEEDSENLLSSKSKMENYKELLQIITGEEEEDVE